LAEAMRAQADLATQQLNQVNAQINAQIKAQLKAAGVTIGADGAMTYVAPGTYQPAGWNPKQFDVSGFLAEAHAKARAQFSDAELMRLDASGVYPTGMADLTLSDDFYVHYIFISPSRAERPVDLPVGVEHKGTCKFHVWVSAQGARPDMMEGWTCEEKTVPLPTCRVDQVWAKAIAKGAPSGNAVAQVGYYDWDGKPRWYVNVADAYSGTFPDRCGSGGARK
jgi:hypothetical protein